MKAASVIPSPNDPALSRHSPNLQPRRRAFEQCKPLDVSFYDLATHGKKSNAISEQQRLLPRMFFEVLHSAI